MGEQDRPEGERPRPRVVDKRVSSGGRSSPQATPPATEPPPAQQAEQPASPPPRGPEGQVWTPEQEAEAKRMAEEIAATPSLEWVVNSAVSLANIAATKLDLGDPADAGLAIDALSGLLKEVGPRLGNVEQPLRQTLAQLQMAFAQYVTAQQKPGAPGSTPA